MTPAYGWRDGVINLDEAFLAPLVFAQAANLVMETIVPYIKLKCLRRAKKLPHVQRRAAARHRLLFEAVIEEQQHGSTTFTVR